LCNEQCRDIQSGKIEGGIAPGFWDPIGYGTAVDSLAAVKKLVFDEKTVSMDELLEALDNDFKGFELIRQRCLKAPKYGNNEPYADAIGKDMETYFRTLSDQYTNYCGGKLDVRYVPVTSHIPLGQMVCATPNGRKAGEPLSEGISPSQGSDIQGPTASLLSVDKTRASEFEWGGEGVLNMKLSPQTVAGKEGTRTLISLIRTWCDLKIWHIQFNIVNSDTLREARKIPRNTGTCWSGSRATAPIFATCPKSFRKRSSTGPNIGSSHRTMESRQICPPRRKGERR
jgi:formate C-acetyltransferase